jgi:hypothetical protein
MQIFDRQLYLNPTSDSSFMESLAFSCADSSAASLPAGVDPSVMSLNAALLHSHELFEPENDLVIPRVECFFIEDCLSAAEKFISLAALTLPDASDSISLLEVSDVDRSTGIRFSIEVPLDTVSTNGIWIIDTDHVESLSITVTGIGFPVNNKLQIVNPLLHCELRERRDHISTGRRICIVNQILIV